MQEPSEQAEELYNQGVALYESRRYLDALACFIKARDVEPTYLSAHWNECVTSLMLGDFETGWPLHEARWQKNEGRWEPDPAKRGWRHLAQPLWLGDVPIKGHVICLWGEQGFGDMLQFCRYALNVQAMGAQVLLLVREPIARLLAHSFAGTSIAVYSDAAALPPFDFHCPLMSLPLACGTTTVEKIPTPIPYIHADPLDVSHWKTELEKHPSISESTTPLKRVGLVWSGALRSQNPQAIQMDLVRSLEFKYLEPLLAMANPSNPSLQFVSLQKDGNPPLDAPLLDLTAGLNDWADTAALVANLDLVISCDTAVAHLAASMGKPTWILSRYNGCWRWLVDRTDSPWYPTVRLFHQPAPGDWASVIGEVMRALR